MDTLTIRTPGLTPDEQVIDIGVITLVQQTSGTNTVIYTSETTEGSVILETSSDPDGKVGDAINNTLLNANSGNAVLVMPTGISITGVTYA
jgi:hypothetical protein